MKGRVLVLCACITLALLTMSVVPVHSGTGWDNALEVAYGPCGATVYMEVMGQWDDGDEFYGYRIVINHAATYSSGQAVPISIVLMWSQSMQYNKEPIDDDYEHGEIGGFPTVSYEWDGYAEGKGTIFAQAKAKAYFYCSSYGDFSVETDWALIYRFS